MPKVGQSYLDARRKQIVDAARTRFTSDGFAGTSMADIVTEAGLSTGSIYRYFASKNEIVVAVCEQGTEAFPTALTLEAVTDFLEHVRALARDKGHARPDLRRSGTFPGAGGNRCTAAHRDAESTRRLDSSRQPERCRTDRRGLCEHLHRL